MRPGAIDRFQAGDSPVHRLDPRVKVVVTVAFIVSNALLPDAAWLGFALAGGLVLLVARAAELAPGLVLRRSLVALPFALAALTTAFSVPGRPIWGLEVGPWTLVATDAGAARFASVVIRGLLSVQMAVLLTATTRFPDLMHALGHLRVPRPLLAVISFMYRYLFVLLDEAGRLLRAREARSAGGAGGPGGGSLPWRARVAGNMAGQLFLRSTERGERVYSAMLARGYAGHLLTLNPHAMRRSDWLAGALALTALVALQLVGRLGRG
jgi:cobalt/nickel transport system permease protein